MLRTARPERATQVLITGADDGDVLVSTVLIRRLAPQLEIIALVKSASVREALHELWCLKDAVADRPDRARGSQEPGGAARGGPA